MTDEGEKQTSQVQRNFTNIAILRAIALWMTAYGHSECNEESQNRRNVKEIFQLKPQNDRKVRGDVSRESRKVAFTLAEVLITLGIIGVIAALTLPSVIQNYQKKVTVERLKKTYSVLSQAVQLSVKDNDDIESWDFSLSTQDFMDKYIVPYISYYKVERVKNALSSNLYYLKDGIAVQGWSWVNPEVKPFVKLEVDINGNAGPNRLGRDKFNFYIFSQAASGYNGGTGDVASQVPKAGLYPDGYGYSRYNMLNYKWRGCNRKGETVVHNGSEVTNAGGAFCTALIMHDGWRISDDYKW